MSRHPCLFVSLTRVSRNAAALVTAFAILSPAFIARAASPVTKPTGSDINTLAKVVDLTRHACLAGAQYDLEANIDGSLTLTRLAPGVKGNVRITQNSGAGGALNYKDEGKRVVADENILKCITTNLPVILNALGTSLVPTQAKACRDPSNGIERYAREFDVTRVSPEMGGGHSQPEWCNSAIESLRGENPTSQFSVLSSNEHSNNHCPPFSCPQYVYTCMVHVKADPIYVEKVSSACR